MVLFWQNPSGRNVAPPECGSTTDAIFLAHEMQVPFQDMVSDCNNRPADTFGCFVCCRRRSLLTKFDQVVIFAPYLTFSDLHSPGCFFVSNHGGRKVCRNPLPMFVSVKCNLERVSLYQYTECRSHYSSLKVIYELTRARSNTQSLLCSSVHIPRFSL